ncbi:hypothetical protein VPH35_045797 [Triticum aestivum]
MAVCYRYEDCMETFSLPVAAPSITVGELKRLIMKTDRHGRGRTRGRGPKESITISNEQTREEYADDDALALPNSTVLVRRVAVPSDIPPLCPRSRQDNGGSSSRSALRSDGTQDDQAKAISAVIDKGRGATHNGWAPPAGYVCHWCRIRLLKGSCACPPMLADESNNDGFPADLHCKICKEVMAGVVVASKCCFNSFCDRCIRVHIIANSECTCGAKASADDLVPNPTLRATIANILAARASSSSGGTEKWSSSAASNKVAASTPQAQSPAASQESTRDSHASSKKGAASESEHSDGSRSTSAPAAHEPRKKQETRETGEMIHVDHQYGYRVPFAPACYDPFLGGMPWPADPSMYYGYTGMPYAYGGGYPTVPPPTRNDGGPYGYHGRKRTRADCEDQSFKRRCGGGRSQAALVLT